MLSFISSWAQQIIFAVIIGVIIQMLLPEGKNKKYIKIVIGVYVLFAVISPVVGKDIDLNLEQFNFIIEENNIANEANIKGSIDDIYINNLKQDVIAKLQNKGYGCENVELDTNENYEVENLKIYGIYESEEDYKENSNNIEKVNNIYINEIQIGEKENKIQDQKVMGIPQSEEYKLKEYLSETYDVKEKNISIE